MAGCDFGFVLSWDFVHVSDYDVNVGVQSNVAVSVAAFVAPHFSAASQFASASYFVFCSATAFEASS